jgi:hypothetical protein
MIRYTLSDTERLVRETGSVDNINFFKFPSYMKCYVTICDISHIRLIAIYRNKPT